MFADPLFLLLTFDVAQMRDNWGRITARPDAPPPAFIAEADDEACVADHELVVRTLELLFRAVVSERLLLPRLIYKMVLGELELAIRQGEIPSEGLGFDNEHAAMLARVDVFGTVDGRFATLAQRAAAELANAGHRVQVIVGTDELVHLLEGL